MVHLVGAINAKRYESSSLCRVVDRTLSRRWLEDHGANTARIGSMSFGVDIARSYERTGVHVARIPCILVFTVHVLQRVCVTSFKRPASPHKASEHPEQSQLSLDTTWDQGLHTGTRLHSTASQFRKYSVSYRSLTLYIPRPPARQF